MKTFLKLTYAFFILLMTLATGCPSSVLVDMAFDDDDE